VKVPRQNVVGQINEGWTVAKYLLTHERTQIGGMLDSGPGLALGAFAAGSVGRDALGRLDDPGLRAQIATFEADEAAFRLTLERARDMAKAGQADPAYSSVLKYYGAELNKRRTELLMAALGADGLEWESPRSREGAAARSWLRAKANSIEGGTSEVQLNIVSKRLLGLPEA
jgi:alkylation response protein AidB-like acyl-CoA dehydrogenase